MNTLDPIKPKQKLNLNLYSLKVLCVILSILALILSGVLGILVLNNPIQDVFLKNLIQAKYYKSTPSSQQYEIGKLKGIVGALEDPYSVYLSKKEYQQFNNDLNRQYEGVGIEFDFETDSKIIVKKTLPNSPASKVDIIQNDDVAAELIGKLLERISAISENSNFWAGTRQKNGNYRQEYT